MKIVILYFICYIIISNHLFAQPGSLDETFGSDGEVTTTFGSADDYCWAVAVQPDGKIITVGNTTASFHNFFALARYNSNGTLDNTFSSDGKTTSDFGTGWCEAYAVALQTDGKIIAAGFFEDDSDDFGLIRYNANGTIDNTFGVNGFVRTDFEGKDDYVNAIKVTTDGKIVAAGSSETDAYDAFALARYKADGTPDSSFSEDGKVITSIGTADDSAWSMAIQPDGKIVAGGSSYNSTTKDDFSLARYNVDGTLDEDFGVNGAVITDFFGGYDNAYSIALQTDGKIVVVGSSNYGNNYLALARYDSTGKPDSSFNSDGKQTTFAGTTFGTSVAIAADGKIIAAGYVNSSTRNYLLARYYSNGTPDSSFNNDGWLTDSWGSYSDYAYGLSLQPDGKIVLAGFTSNNVATEFDFALSRYLSEFNVGLIDLSIPGNTLFIYPNPVTQHTTLQYTLKSTEIISIQLLDMEGRFVKTLINSEQQQEGCHQLELDLPHSLPGGTYFMVISNEYGAKVSTQIFKQ